MNAEMEKEVETMLDAVCQDFDVMWNEYFMRYETYRIVLKPHFPLPVIPPKTPKCVF
jgi:hypothetical protein